MQRECNWLQALEGDIDTSHFGFLHGGGTHREGLRPTISLRYRASINRSPDYNHARPNGARCTRAYRPATPGDTY